MSFHRYVALGDSFTEGVGDHDADRPNGVRGWADRVAEVLAEQADPFGYANLAIRGRKMAGVLAEQVEPAVALEPDLVTIYAGANDILRPKVDIDTIVAAYDEGVGRLASTGARVLMFTGFDLGLAPCSDTCGGVWRRTTSWCVRWPSGTAPVSSTSGGCASTATSACGTSTAST